MKFRMTLCVLSMLTCAAVQASSVAVIDSGLDTTHAMISPNLWVNPLEVMDRRDNDNNGYQDDVHGWNFADQNAELIDMKYLGTFSADCTKYFDIQGKMFLRTATEAEIAWLKEKVQDKKFIAEMGKFGNFVHGTHVAGISMRNSLNKVMGIKLIPTEIKPFGKNHAPTADRWSLLEQGLDALASEQMKLLTSIASFVDSHKVEVANGSFGTGFKQAKMITDNLFKVLFFRKPTAEESDKAAGLFMSALLKHGQTFVAAAPKTLFVFAAGNDGMNNDLYGSSPANIKADNVISVGATYNNEFFAPFSNYGVKMVEVAAPGMLIKSAIPGGDYLQVSGTSQASPYVANVAAQIKNANPALSPADVKKILMGTVDKKAFLSEKVTSGGIVNTDRAVVAGANSTSMSVAEAISRARSSVKDMPVENTPDVNAKSVVPMPLTPMFK